MSFRCWTILTVVLLEFCSASRAETVTFGQGDNAFAVEFVAVRDTMNPMDKGILRIETGEFSPVGQVDYVFSIGKFEISRDMMFKANAEGGLDITVGSYPDVASGPRPNMPAHEISWSEAARFVNWLNMSSGYPPAYKFEIQPGEPGYRPDAPNLLWEEQDVGFDSSNLFRNSLSRFALPSADEWHKAAYYDPRANDGLGGYWGYPTGSDRSPKKITSGVEAGSAVYRLPFQQGPADITQAGGLSPYGAMAMGGNVPELQETAFDLHNDDAAEFRGYRGGGWSNGTLSLGSTQMGPVHPLDDSGIGFRVVSRADGILGDFDGDGAYTSMDIDLLSSQIVLGTSTPRFDLTEDGLVSVLDHAFWVERLANTYFGDSDLNGTVEFADFLQLSANFGLPVGWTGGDFDGNGTVEFADFLLLSDNFGKTRPASAVPEPSTLALVLVMLLIVTARRRAMLRPADTPGETIGDHLSGLST